MTVHLCRSFVAILLASAAALPARAQLAVIDIPAIVQLIQEVQAMEQAVQTAQSQLAQARQALQTMTGDRGMEFLLSGISRNYLPSSWPELTVALQGGSGGYAGLSSDVRTAVLANSVLSAQQMAALSASDQRQITARRQSSALREALVQRELTNVSGRFASIQTLIDAIPAAVDQKGILDLQARIDAELGMLQNEQTKLQVLRQAMQARDSVDNQQERERLIAGHGIFSSRFQPSP